MNGYAFALLAAFFYGISPNIAKWGLVGGMPQALATVVSTASAVPLYYLMMAARRKSLRLPRVEPGAWLFVIMAGATHTVGTLFQFAALKLEYISVVQSVINLNPLVAVSLLLILGTEKVSRNLIIGAVLVVTGSILVVTR